MRSKNEVILITLISLIESQALSDTVFASDSDCTLFETLLDEIECDKGMMDEVIDSWQEGDDSDLLASLKVLLGYEKDGLLKGDKQ